MLRYVYNGARAGVSYEMLCYVMLRYIYNGARVVLLLRYEM